MNVTSLAANARELALIEVEKALAELLNHAQEVHQANGRKDFDAGRYDGLKEALETVRKVAR